MTARAESTAATRRAIIEAWLALFTECDYADITLELVASRAGVAGQTVLRHFGSKDELVAAVVRDVAADEAARRAVSPVGDVPAAVRSVVGHYERIGEVMLRLLAQEARLAALRDAADTGRRIHRDWVERAFAPYLEPLAGPERRVCAGQLVALTDLYVWKILRRDLGFGRRRTEEAMTEMVSALLTGAR